MKVRKVKYVKSTVDNYVVFTRRYKLVSRAVAYSNINTINIYVRAAYNGQLTINSLNAPVIKGIGYHLYGLDIESQNIHCATYNLYANIVLPRVFGC
jgi:hypothetical protein